MTRGAHWHKVRLETAEFPQGLGIEARCRGAPADASLIDLHLDCNGVARWRATEISDRKDAAWMASSQPAVPAGPEVGKPATAESGVSIPPCRVCQRHRTSLYFTHRGFRLIKCEDCSTVFSLDEPDLRRIEQHFSSEYFLGGQVEYADYVSEESAHRAQARRYLDVMHALGVHGSSLFDIGCAAGFFLDEARGAGWTVAGCDVSEAAVAYARGTLGLEVVRGDFLEATSQGSVYDVVTAFNVFEHLPRPRVVAARLSSIVRHGGHVILETWDHQSWAARALGRRWHQWDPPFVPYYYTRRSLETLFQPGEWRMVHYGRFAKRISLGRALTVVRTRYLPAAVGGMVRRFSTSKVGSVHLSYGLDDLVLVAFERL